MAWIFSLESVASRLHSDHGLGPWRIAKMTATRKLSYCIESKRVIYQKRQSGMTFARFVEKCCHPLISSQAVSRARILALQEMALAWKASEADYFSRSSGLLMNVNQDGFFSKTCPLFGLEEPSKLSGRWPAAGMTVGGSLYELVTSAHHMKETAGGCLPIIPTVFPTPTACHYGSNQGGSAGRENQQQRLILQAMAKKNKWPTPRATDGAKGGPNQSYGTGSMTLPAAVAKWPTPTARDWKSGSHGNQGNARPLSEKIGGQLSADWTEWLMGYPIGWTVCGDWVTLWSRRRRGKRFKFWRG